ncbi:MAG: PVC-type heme-binding CxxCH protein [Isosphaeraceae bacterium]
MQLSRRFISIAAVAAALAVSAFGDDRPSVQGALPTDAKGKPLNLDFETGTLNDWTAAGEAFAGQPVEGDTVHARRGDMTSSHQGRFWIGSFERNGDLPQGTLTSSPFIVTRPFASFLVAGGAHPSTRVELVLEDKGEVITRVSGDDTEVLKRVIVDLSSHQGKTIFIRLVDDHSGGWGHLNFDDFRFHETKPDVPLRSKVAPPDSFAHAGLDPDAAAKAMTVPDGFAVTLFAGEPDVVQPIAFTIDDRDRLWVAEAYSYPRRVPDDQAKDRILIFEDTDGDGRFDSRKVFIDTLNLVSGLEVGFGGVWVGAAPELLFIPDRDLDDVPDGKPIVKLDGWGHHDTHETLNSFTWGPDGWLYGCHGVFTHSRVGPPGTPDANRTPLNAGVWRFHPTTHRFEVFAQGTSNPWGVDFDEHGQAFLTACVIPHLYHVIQGGRYERQAGQHFNPYTYDDIKTIADHRHYLGAAPHAGNGRSDAAGGGHAHAGALIYQGGAWPAPYRGSIFMNNIHGARINRDLLIPEGSGFNGRHAPDLVKANDLWSQIVSLRSGPDGNVYMIDWYDKNQCHHNDVNAHDRTNGRIFKVVYGDPKPVRVDLARMSDVDLVGLLSHQNDWFARHARRILQERGRIDPKARTELRRLAFNADLDTIRLQGLWALHGTGGLDEAMIARGLNDPAPHNRAWTIQLAMETKAPSSETLGRFAELAKDDSSPVVRLYLASALQRMPPERRWDVLNHLIHHANDANDHNLPLMSWYAAEPLAEIDMRRAANLAAGSRIPLIRSFMTRRIASIGTFDAFALLVDQLGQAETSSARLTMLQGVNEALKGRQALAMPPGWAKVSTALRNDVDPGVRSQATTLGVTFGDPAALTSLRAIIEDGKAANPQRIDALTALLKVRDPHLPSALHALLGDPLLRSSALRGLASFNDPETPRLILKGYNTYTRAERRDALNTLASRVKTAKALMAAVIANQVPSSDLSADLVRQLRNLDDPELDAKVAEVWGAVHVSDKDTVERITAYRTLLTSQPNQPPDPVLGRAVFDKTCAQCHTLFDAGGKVGPDLTGSNRADLDYLLSNVLDPNALIGKDYQAHIIALTDGRVLTGLLRGEDKNAVTLVTANETITIPKPEIEDRRTSDKSMMPEDLWTPLSPHEVRSLVRYLASPTQVAKGKEPS